MSRSGVDWSAVGTRFRGSSDTEVLVAAVERWGLDRALDACEGMFAAALWDRRERHLHLVRDRFGEKPLYFGWVGNMFAFGSELKAVCTLPRFAPELDRRAVARYLRHNCIPAPDTIYRGIRKLLPGHLVTLTTSSTPGMLPDQRCYWSATEAVERARQRPLSGTDIELTDQLESTLSDSVAARMVADVPVGAFLSGGDRFEHHRRPDATALHQPGPHLHYRVCRPVLRRVCRGGRRGRAPRDRSHRGGDRRCRSRRSDQPPAGRLGRTIRRRLPDPDLPGQPGRAGST